MKISVFPSLPSVNKKNISFLVDKLIDLGIKHIHFNVSDKKFAGYTSLKLSDFKKITDKKIKCDIHLMVSNPRGYAKKFISLGAKTIIFHYESFVSEIPMAKLINSLHLSKVKVGIAFKADTGIEKKTFFFLKMVDFILITSIDSKKNEQKFNKKVLKKIKLCFDYIRQNNLKTLIEVEGGIDEKNCLECCRNGASILVVGSYLFKSEDEIKEKINRITNRCDGVIRI